MKNYEPAPLYKHNGFLTVVNPKKLNTPEQRMKAAFDFCKERHMVFLRKASGLPKPWTDDYVLQQYRFCNIYRELDSVSLWIRDNMIRPFSNYEHLWFMLATARFFNKPDTLKLLLDSGVLGGTRFNPERALAEVKKAQAQNGAVFNSAYIINGIPAKNSNAPEQSKIATVIYDVLEPMWKDRKELSKVFRTDFASSLKALMQYHGNGAFMANQIVVDLTYCDSFLKNAPDIDTNCSPGPGTRKGAAFLANNMTEKLGTKEVEEQMYAFFEAAKSKEYWPNDSKDPEKGFSRISMPNTSNAFCESSKMMAIILGHRNRLKNSYVGYVEKDSRQKPLF